MSRGVTEEEGCRLSPTGGLAHEMVRCCCRDVKIGDGSNNASRIVYEREGERQHLTGGSRIVWSIHVVNELFLQGVVNDL